MYLNHFHLNKAPFSLTPNTEFFCALPTHKEALNVLLISLAQGEGFIKIVGEVGTGKTLLCRLLLNYLPGEFVTAYIPNPDQTAESLRYSLARDLGIQPNDDWSQNQVLEAINQCLLELRRVGKKTVLIIDEAQVLSNECLEAIRLLTNLETEQHKLLQVVLFGQPEIDVKLNQLCLRQLKQRITFSYYLQPLERHELDKYLHHRMACAGYPYGNLFTQAAQRRLYRASQGLPRLLNILCHKSLLVAYGQGKLRVDGQAMSRAIADTISSRSEGIYSLLLYFGIGAIIISSLLMMYWTYGQNL